MTAVGGLGVVSADTLASGGETPEIGVTDKQVEASIDNSTGTIETTSEHFVGDGYVVGQKSNRDYLQEVNTTTAGTREVGPVGQGIQIKDMSFQPNTGVLYATRGGNSGGVRAGTIDLSTGAYTDLPQAFGSGTGADGKTITLNRIEALSFDPGTGILYAVHERPSGLDLLFKVDTTTGAVVKDGFGPGVDYVQIKPAPGGTGNDDIDGLAIDPTNGQMYGLAKASGSSDTLIRIDKTTGDSTFVGKLNLNNMEGLSFTPGGDLFGTTVSGGGSGTGIANALYSVDKNTGQTTAVDQMDLSKYEALALDMGTQSSGPSADLSLTKTANTSTVVQHETVEFTVNVTNDGPDPTTGVTVNDTLSEGLTFVSASESKGIFDGSTGVWNIGELDDGETVTLTLVAKATGAVGSEEENYAEVATSDVEDPDSTPGDGSRGADDDAFVPVTITDVDQADLELEKIVDDAAPAPGSTVNYTVTIRNNGPQNATGVVVSEQLPPGLSFLEASASAGSYDNTTGEWTVGNLTAGMSATLTLTAQVDAGAGIELTNTATISESSPDDPTTDDRNASSTIVVTAADIAVTKHVDYATPTVGDTVTFTLTAENLGPSDATGVFVEDQLPTGLEFVSADPVEFYDPETGLWTIGNLFAGENRTLEITALVNTSAEVENIVSVNESDQFDGNPDNDNDFVTVTPQEPETGADLSVTKNVDDTTPAIGDTVTFSVTVTNNGPENATGVKLTDQLPAGLEFSSVTPQTGTYDIGTGVWNIGDLASGDSVTLTLTATVDTDEEATNVAEITESDQSDFDKTNNNDSATVVPQVAVPESDLAVTKTVNESAVDVDDTVEFTVELTNNGPDEATGVTLTDDFARPGLTVVNADPTQGTFNGETWAVGTLPVGETVTLTSTVRVDAAGTYTNLAVITGSDQVDPDGTNDGDFATVTAGEQEADLGVAKSVNASEVTAGDVVDFTISVSNAGPNDATGVSVEEALPPGLTVVDSSTTQGAYAGNVWDIGTVSAGASPSLTLSVRVEQAGTYENIAGIRTSDQVDPVLGNNTDTATVTAQPREIVYQSASITGVLTDREDRSLDATVFVSEIKDTQNNVQFEIAPRNLESLDLFTVTAVDLVTGAEIESTTVTAQQLEAYTFPGFQANYSLAADERPFNMLAPRAGSRTTLSPVPALERDTQDQGVSIALTAVQPITGETGTSVATKMEVDRTSSASVVGISPLEPAVFEVRDLNPANATVDTNEVFTVNATIQNTGEVKAVKDVELRIDGEPIDSQLVELAGGEDGTVEFVVAASQLGPGEYTHSVWTEDDEVTGTLVVGGADLSPYTNVDGIITTDGLRDAIDDWRAGEINTDLLRDVIDAWRAGEPVV